MSSQRNLGEIVEILERLVRDSQADKGSLEEKMRQAEEFIRHYRQYREQDARSTLDVRMMSVEAGELVEKPFNWRELG